MEQYYSNDSLTAYKTEDGIYIEERKKGSLKMLLVIAGISLLAIVASFLFGLLGGKMLRIFAPMLFWGGTIILGMSVLAVLIKMSVQANPKITFDTNNNELSVRGKVFPFASIDKIEPSLQHLMGRTMTVAFIVMGSRKKSLFSVAIVDPYPENLVEFISDLDEIVQKAKLSEAVLDQMTNN